jgi:indolepyruvate ferredoxin oxidoreductase
MAFDAPAQFSLDDKYALDTTRTYLTGIEALVRLPILQHQRDRQAGLNTAGFISGYRGSPLGGLDQALWKAQAHLDAHDIVFQPGVNEDLAATAIWGSQQVNMFEGARYDGVFSMWYGKGPGVDRSLDAVRHANAAGTSKHGGVLFVAGDDHACKSSTLPHQTEHVFIGASMPVLNPADVQDILDLGIFGWELSRYSGCWVAMKAITENMDSGISAQIDPARVPITIPGDFELPADGVHARWPDPPLDQERRLNKYKIYAARHFAYVNKLNRVVIDSPNPRLGIITTGKAYLDVLQALEDLGIDKQRAAEIGLRVYKLGMSWPLEPIATHEFARGLEEILVVEEKRSIVEDQLTGQLYNWPVEERPRVIGEFDEHGRDLLPNLGELTPAQVARAIASRISRFYNSRTMEERLEFLKAKEQRLSRPRATITRAPHYCSGCPHNTSTKVPEGSMALGGIGCHYMVTWMDRRTATFTQMGGEGATWVGQAPFTDRKHVFQNLGDGTYYHSGILAIRQAIAAGVNITYKILYNDAVAMTGGQPIDGTLTVEQIVHQLRGEGVTRIAVVSDEPDKYPSSFPKFEGLTVDHRRRLEAIQLELRETPGTTVIIYDQTCAAEKRRRRKKGLMADPKKRVIINEAVCEGCGDCGTASNCLSVLPKETELGRKRTIDQSACNKDFSCLDGFCPSFVTVHGGEPARPAAAGNDADSLPALTDPAPPRLDRPWNILITGIGGSGVLTVASILAVAAHMEGKGCATLNQTGLAQKFGSVFSHVRIGAAQEDIHAVRIAAGDADLLLGCDIVVASSFDALAKLHADRTHAVINEHVSPTSEFLRNPDMAFPADDMKALIMEESGKGRAHFVEATDTATQLLGDAVASNMFLLGYAWQKGLVPVGREAIFRAIEINNVAVEFNKQAFTWGRRAASQPDEIESLLRDPVGEVQPLEKLEDIVNYRARELTRYQNEAYALDYRDFIEKVRRAEQDAIPGETRLSKAVARSLYKLMACKDEYEVARLFTSGEFMQRMKEQFHGDFRLRFHLAPPFLAGRDPVTGHPRKRAWPGWTLNVFRALAAMKHLRGTPFDIFGYSRERKTERRLISEYRNTIEGLLADLAPRNHDLSAQIAELPQRMRGFGHVKLANIEKAKAEEKRLLEQRRSRAYLRTA